MAIFSFGKKKQTEGFEFKIHDTYSVKDSGSAVVTGMLNQGRFVPGTTAVCLDRDRNPLFRCRIQGIEQGTRILKIASADSQGDYGARYGLKLGGVSRQHIPEDGYLVSEAPELLEALEEKGAAAPKAGEESGASAFAGSHLGHQENSHVLVVDPSKFHRGMPTDEKEENAGPLGREREDELAHLLEGEAIDREKLEPLTIQETIFLLCCFQLANRETKEAHYREKGQVIYETILEKLRNAPALYVIIDEGSTLPLITGDTVDVYTTRELAEKAVAFYSQQYRHLFIKEMPNGKTDLPGRIHLFHWFYYLGMERILVDNGSYQLAVNRRDLMPEAEEKVKKSQVPVVNPKLRFAMADYLEEARWHVSYPEREENMKNKKDRMDALLLRSQFLVPMKYEGGALKRGENQISFSENNSMKFPRIENNLGQYFIPMFTDWPEFRRGYRKEEWAAMVLDLRALIGLADKDGLVVNPLTENLILNREALGGLREKLALAASVKKTR